MELLKFVCLPALASLVLMLGASPVRSEVSTPWQTGFNNKARLIAGRASDGRVYAGFEIEMPAGWKTYWRQPGEAGGVPPEFDLAKSGNLAASRVLYPAPHRLIDKAGASIGYKDRVLFPIALERQNGEQPITLRVDASYGVCEKLCVPAEASLSLDVPADPGPSEALEQALKRVPGAARTDVDPRLVAGRVVGLDGATPQLILEVQSQSPGDVDAFVDGDGLYIPLPKKSAASGSAVTFSVDLSDGVDVKDLRGKSVTITLVDSAGQSEAVVPIE